MALLLNSTVTEDGGDAILGLIGHKTGWVTQLRILTYVLWPSELYYPTMESIPNFAIELWPLVTVLILVEAVVKGCSKQMDTGRLNNYVTNITSLTILYAFTEFAFRGAELIAYIWVYENFRLITMPYNSVYTYVFAFLMVDYLAYWWHRGSHEIAVFWAAHEYHHSSEDYNLAVTMRLPYTIRLYKWLFYLPTALMGLPVSIMHTHAQLGLIFNSFNHISIIPPLETVIPVIGHIYEYFFVTPQHHKIHHALNEYALDTNYGNVLIIWDRLHGTFATEKQGEKITYGSLTPLSSFSVLDQQLDPFRQMWSKVEAMDNFPDKLRAVFYGPGWYPGKPRLGLTSELPDMRGRPKWETQHPLWVKLYILINSFALFPIYIDNSKRLNDLSMMYLLFPCTLIFYGFWSLGTVLDYHRDAARFEALRVTIILASQFLTSTPLVASPVSAKITIAIACFDILLLPFIAKTVSNRRNKGPSDLDLYRKKLEKLNYIKLDQKSK